jgi:flagellar motor switch protein FliN
MIEPHTARTETETGALGRAPAMSDAVVYEQLDEPSGDPAGTERNGAPPGAAQNGADLRRLSDVPMELSVEIGRTRMTVGETLQLHAGSIITLERLAGEPVDLLVNGTPIARGEVVIVDEEFGLRVTEIIEGGPAAPNFGEQEDGNPLDAGDPASPGTAPAPAPPVPAQPAPAQADSAVQE